MSRRVGCVVVAGIALLAAGIFVVFVVQHRGNQDRVYCQNNLRQIAQFSEEAGKRAKADPAAFRWDAGPAIPPGTVPNLALPPDRRLSWVVPLLSSFDQRQQDTAALAGQINLSLPWDAAPHREAARTRLSVLRCYGNPIDPPAGSPAVTQYVGNGGVGAGAPARPIVPFPLAAGRFVAPPGAGAFRYDDATPYAAVTDGLSETVLFAEVSTDLGPWLRGGPGTVRALDDRPGAPRPIRAGGQFGGNHPGGGANFAFADQHVAFFTPRADAAVLHKLFTIAGDGAGLPGE